MLSCLSCVLSLGNALKEKPKPVPEHLKAEKMKKAYYLMQKIPDQVQNNLLCYLHCHARPMSQPAPHILSLFPLQVVLFSVVSQITECTWAPVGYKTVGQKQIWFA